MRSLEPQERHNAEMLPSERAARRRSAPRMSRRPMMTYRFRALARIPISAMLCQLVACLPLAAEAGELYSSSAKDVVPVSVSADLDYVLATNPASQGLVLVNSGNGHAAIVSGSPNS